MTPEKSPIRGPGRRLCAPVLVALGCIGTCLGQTPLVGNSPFAPSGAAGTAAAGAPAEAFELSGSTVQGSDVSVCIYERQAKHSQWIPVGGIVDGVHVISFDPLRDTAVVVISGSRKELAMRTAVVAAIGPSTSGRAAPTIGAPAATLQPIASAPPAVQTSAATEQREARMLVSDLLEIGVQQRKAYQEAKQKAASGQPAPPDN